MSDFPTGAAFLDKAKEELTCGDPVERSVREFIGYWGADRRGVRVVRRINNALRNKGLRTVPDFNETGLDSTIQLQLAQNGSAIGDRDYGLTIGKMPSARTDVMTVDISDDLMKAYTLMQLHDFSQLPVKRGDEHQRKVVTWRSLVKALLSKKTKVVDALEEVIVIPYDRDLLHEASKIALNDFVLVEDENGQISGIVTTSDVSVLFAGQSETFLQLGEIDQRLRDAIEAKFKLGEVQSATNDKRVKDFDDMTMYHYQQVLTPPKNWSRLGWALDHGVFLEVLDEVRLVRNDVMHFNPDPIESDRLVTVGSLLRLLRQNT